MLVQGGEMRRYALVFLISCFVLSATAVRAAELEGFGPIKFGMTKEEAWAAIDGKGEWKSDRVLVYDYKIDRGTITLEARQAFYDGRAMEVVVSYSTPKDAPATLNGCRGRMLVISGLIQEKYKINPLVYFGEKDVSHQKNKKLYAAFDVVLFSFAKGAYIKIDGSMRVSRNVDYCEILLLYRPPTDDKIPF